LVDRARVEPSQVVDVAYLYGINLVVIQGENSLLVVLEGARSLMKNPTWRVGLFPLWMK
jgi:hypothetical protein